jgi:hypothetical protein
LTFVVPVTHDNAPVAASQLPGHCRLIRWWDKLIVKGWLGGEMTICPRQANTPSAFNCVPNHPTKLFHQTHFFKKKRDNSLAVTEKASTFALAIRKCTSRKRAKQQQSMHP